MDKVIRNTPENWLLAHYNVYINTDFGEETLVLLILFASKIPEVLWFIHRQLTE